MPSPATQFLRRLTAVARVTEWWGYKFAPILATGFATALLGNRSVWAIAGRLLLLLLALTAAATYVSLLNDWTDRADDHAAGKTNRLAHTSTGRFAALLGTCLAVGSGFLLYFWSVGPGISLLYVGTWVVYTLYSLPPFRLKARGLAGVLADAAGAHLFPQLLAAALVLRWTQQPAAGPWLALVGTWASCSGIRNIIWHQLSDAENDAQAGVGTFVTRAGAGRARRLAEWLAFPLEVLALLALLVLGGHLAPALALALYGGLVLVRGLGWKQTLVVAQPGPMQHILLNEYYEVFYPMALLLTACYRTSADGWALAGFGLLFGYSIQPTFRSLRDATVYLSQALRARTRAFLKRRSPA